MITKIDFLSPPITLFHLEKRTHTSNIGGLFVLIMVSICSLYISFLLYDLVNHKIITSIFHKQFEFEAGYYSFNSSSIFHFIQIFSPENGGYFDKYDSRYIRAYITYVHSNFSYGNLHLYDHWVFDNCRKNIDDKDIEPYLLENIENFTNGVCIRYYYNSSEKKYYSLEDKGFLWPHLEHGIAQRNNIYLTTIIQKCSNDSIINKIFGECPSKKEIDDYVSKYFGIYLYFTDIQVDPTNYTNPVQRYLQVISTGMSTPQAFVENYIYFSPLKVRTRLGTLFGKIYDINSFYFDFNRKGAANNNEEYYVITKYYHLLQNNVQIYERKYNNFFDILSEIGGEVQFVFYLFYWINYVYNKYIIAYDTNILFFSIKDNRSTIKEIHAKKFIISKFNKNDIQLNNAIKNINKLELDKKRDNKIFKNINNLKIKLTDINNNKNNFIYNKIILKNISKDKYRTNQNESKDILRDNKSFISYNYKKESNSFAHINAKESLQKNKTYNESYNDYIDKLNLSRISLAKIEHKKKRSIKITSDNQGDMKYFSFLNYLKAIIFKVPKNTHNFIRIFRKHLLSEEHLLKSHIKMVFLEKKNNFNGEEKTNALECFNEL